MRHSVPIGVKLAWVALAAIVALPVLLPRAGGASAPRGGAGIVPPPARAPATGDVPSLARDHAHVLPLTATHWYATVHGAEGALAQVIAIDGSGKVTGPVLGPLPAAEPPLAELRGMLTLANGDLAVLNAKHTASRLVLFGAPDAATGIRPYRSTVIRNDPANPAFVHPYQVAVGPDGAIYASNQDTNTITRYRGFGSWSRGTPADAPRGLAQFGTLAPGTVVPSDGESPEGLGEVRGFAFGPDGLIYACDRGRSRVAAYDPATGRLVKVVADASGGLKHPIQATFTPDARALLVSDNGRNCVWSVSVASGRVSELVRPGAGGLDAPSALALQGDVLYVGSRLGKKVLKFDARDGAFIGVFCELPSNPEFFVAGR
jgi:hypothetical protein